jgi:hypothetical protein
MASAKLAEPKQNPAAHRIAALGYHEAWLGEPKSHSLGESYPSENLHVQCLKKDIASA